MTGGRGVGGLEDCAPGTGIMDVLDLEGGLTVTREGPACAGPFDAREVGITAAAIFCGACWTAAKWGFGAGLLSRPPD